MTPLRIVFAGTPDFSVPTLQALLDSPHEVVGVYTQPDRPAGRGRQLQASPVKVLAHFAGIPLFQPKSLRSPEAQADLADLRPDVMVVVAYGLILPEAVLALPKYGCINVHASLLPRWRGAAPIQCAILAGDRESGITLMQMDKGLDTGPMLKQIPVYLDPRETSASLHDKLAPLGNNALLNILEDLPAALAGATPQPEDGLTYAHKIEKAQGAVDWTESAEIIERKIRGFNPWPVAYGELAGERIRFWEAEMAAGEASAAPGTVVQVDRTGVTVATGEGLIKLTKVQLPGKRAMTVQEVLNGKQPIFSDGLMFS